MGAVSGMMTGPVEGRFLEFLVFALRPQLVLEIGTFTGYSSISMASVLPPGIESREASLALGKDFRPGETSPITILTTVAGVAVLLLLR